MRGQVIVPADYASPRRSILWRDPDHSWTQKGELSNIRNDPGRRRNLLFGDLNHNWSRFWYGNRNWFRLGLFHTNDRNPETLVD